MAQRGLQGARTVRFVGVDLLRGIAILLVLGIHFFGYMAFVTEEPNRNLSAIYRVFGHGYYGVSMFFVISGFLIASTSIVVDGEGKLGLHAGRFYVRRATRILPLLALLLALLVPLFLQLGHDTGTAAYVFKIDGEVGLGMLLTSVVTFTFNWLKIAVGPERDPFGLAWNVLWSLAVEEQFYLVFPAVIGLARSRLRLRTFLFGVVGVGTVLRAVLLASEHYHPGATINSFTCFDQLALGVLVAISAPWPLRASTIAIIAGTAGLALCYVLPSDSLLGLPVLGLSISVAALIQGFRTLETRHRVARWLAVPFLGALGRLSYGAYLLHATALFLAGTLLVRPTLNPIVGFVGFVLLVYAVARISFEVYERPVERALRTRLYRWLNRRETVARQTA